MYDRSMAATHEHPETEASVARLVTGIVDDAQQLLRQQITLLKHEVRRDLKDARQMSVSFAASCILGGIAPVLLAFTLVYLVSWIWPGLPLWGSFAGMTCVLGGTATVLLFFARGKLED